MENVMAVRPAACSRGGSDQEGDEDGEEVEQVGDGDDERPSHDGQAGLELVELAGTGLAQQRWEWGGGGQGSRLEGQVEMGGAAAW